MTLLLGPPGSGKTSLLLALAGKLDAELKVFDSKLIRTKLFNKYERQEGINLFMKPVSSDIS